MAIRTVGIQRTPTGNSVTDAREKITINNTMNEFIF